MSRARRMALRETRREQARERDAAAAAAAPAVSVGSGGFQVRVDIRPPPGGAPAPSAVSAPAVASPDGDVGRAVRAIVAWHNGTEARGDPETVARVEQLFGALLGLSGDELVGAIERAGVNVAPELRAKLRAAVAGGAAELVTKARLIDGLNLPLLQAAAANLYDTVASVGRRTQT